MVNHRFGFMSPNHLHPTVSNESPVGEHPAMPPGAPIEAYGYDALPPVDANAVKAGTRASAAASAMKNQTFQVRFMDRMSCHLL